ncbi:hypothetical protein SAMN04488504_12658, partial [Myxococcus virescens]
DYGIRPNFANRPAGPRKRLAVPYAHSPNSMILFGISMSANPRRSVHRDGFAEAYRTSGPSTSKGALAP